MSVSEWRDEPTQTMHGVWQALACVGYMEHRSKDAVWLLQSNALQFEEATDIQKRIVHYDDNVHQKRAMQNFHLGQIGKL